jgi:hypothetical protein
MGVQESIPNLSGSARWLLFKDPDEDDIRSIRCHITGLTAMEGAQRLSGGS